MNPEEHFPACGALSVTRTHSWSRKLRKCFPGPCNLLVLLRSKKVVSTYIFHWTGSDVCKSATFDTNDFKELTFDSAQVTLTTPNSRMSVQRTGAAGFDPQLSTVCHQTPLPRLTPYPSTTVILHPPTTPTSYTPTAPLTPSTGKQKDI